MNEIRTHYDNLKVSREAPPEVIKAAYKALTQKYHPDKNPGDEEALRITALLNGSYEVLIDPVRRKHHDRWIASREREGSDGEVIEELAGRAYPLRLSRGRAGITASLLAFSRRRPLLTAALPGMLVASVLSGVMLAQDRDAQRLREAQWVAWLMQTRQPENPDRSDEMASAGSNGESFRSSAVTAPEAYSALPEPVIVTSPTTRRVQEPRENEAVDRAWLSSPTVPTRSGLARGSGEDTSPAPKHRASDARDPSDVRAEACGASGDSPAFQDLVVAQHNVLLPRFTTFDCGGRQSGEIYEIVEQADETGVVQR